MVKSFEHDDPMAMVGVRFEEEPDGQAIEEMARVIVEEYIRLGFSSDQMLRIFQSRAFHLAHRVLEVKGEEFVRELVGAADVMRAQIAAQEKHR